MKGKITISRVSGGNTNGHINITIEDAESNIQFFDGDMSFEDFAKAVTGQGYLPIEFQARNLTNVGKRRETKPLVFEVPNRYSCREWAEANCQQFADEGWTADPYFRSQNSFCVSESGKTYAYGRQYRYVE